jgi:AraC-like DNA-binding protein
MKWQVFRPSISLQHLVKCYCVYEQEDDALVPPRLALPSPTPALVLRYDTLRRPSLPPDVAALRPAVGWLCRPVSELRQEVQCGPTNGLLGITFQPTGFYQLFGMSVGLASGAGPAVAGAAGRFIRTLDQQIRRAASTFGRIAAIEKQLRARQKLGPQLPLAVQNLTTSIVQQHGQININALAAGANLCRRQFERHFRKVVGVSPKLFAEISRFHFVMQQLHQQPPLNWQDIIHACGYYDQAHFIREFRRFMGEPPDTYLHLQQRHAAAAPGAPMNVAFLQCNFLL